MVRSFARIHETNLKKQGVLPLTFVDSNDYEKVREGDAVTLLDLEHLSPDRGLTAVLEHEDGTTQEIQLNHTMNEEQVAWFRAGSALNLLRREAQGN